MRIAGAITVAAVMSICAGEAAAQYDVFNPSRSIMRGASIRRPTVSPYTELLVPGAGATSYFTRVRPQLQQQQINRQAAANFQQLQREIGQISQSNRSGPRSDETIRATGHPTRFFFYGTYYPGLNR